MNQRVVHHGIVAPQSRAWTALQKALFFSDFSGDWRTIVSVISSTLVPLH